MKNKPKSYSSEQIEWLRANRPKYQVDDLTIKYNWQFNENRTKHAINRILVINKIRGSTDGRFTKNNAPWNKGVTGVMVANRGSFQKGHRGSRCRTVGSVRLVVERSGRKTAQIKTAEPNLWEPYARIIYKRAYGPIKPGNLIIFIDGDHTNYHYTNLAQISRQVLGALHKKRAHEAPVEYRRPLINLAKLEQAIKEHEYR